jgi:hypothetical protein
VNSPCIEVYLQATIGSAETALSKHREAIAVTLTRNAMRRTCAIGWSVCRLTSPAKHCIAYPDGEL